MKNRIEKGYFTVAELEKYCSISQRTLRTQMNDPVNPIPHFRVGTAGRIIRIKKSEFDLWMDSQRATQGSEIDELIEGILK
jgi:hypothetical protein